MKYWAVICRLLTWICRLLTYLNEKSQPSLWRIVVLSNKSVVTLFNKEKYVWSSLSLYIEGEIAALFVEKKMIILSPFCQMIAFIYIYIYTH